MQCEQRTRATPPQRETLQTLENQLQTLIRYLRKIEPFEPAWALIAQQWRGRVFLGNRLNVPSYSKESGCMTIGLDSNGSRDIFPRLLGRCILTMVKESIQSSACAQQMRRAIEVAETDLAMKVDLSCDDVKEFGLVQTKWYKAKQCDSKTYDKRRWTFEELLGHDVDEAVNMFREVYPDLHIVLRSWDTLHEAGTFDLHPEKETVVISYDLKTNKVVLPEPRITTMQNMDGVEGHCFMLPEEGRCMGAPGTMPDEWQILIGKNLMDATDSLRFNYPHALVETVPNTYGLSPIKRRDRIRVLFDPKTAKTTQIILG
jgi:hypothetical protein